MNFKKLFLSVVLLAGLAMAVNAEEQISIPYKNIKEKSKISYNTENDVWTEKVDRKSDNYYVKTISDGTGNYSEFLNPDDSFAFTTGCQYEFIYKGNLIGYSNHELKFYDFALTDGELTRRELPFEEVQEMFPEYKIVKVSEFSPNTNSLKIKKQGKNFKLMLLNDTDRYFYHYSFTSNNAKFKTSQLKGLLDVTKKGMIQFSHFGDNTKNFPWFIILVR